MNKEAALRPEYIDTTKLLFYKPKNKDTVTHVAWDKV